MIAALPEQALLQHDKGFVNVIPDPGQLHEGHQPQETLFIKYIIQIYKLNTNHRIILLHCITTDDKEEIE